ncbi:hypothetical protein [Prescottella subtropica]|uniref:hypothetical protein n=1 Tax=Prescottella subtropica TaxID=2545757 RepID=UPI0010F4D860|nr:hypothetical protein [Prescottella subtropica]
MTTEKPSSAGQSEDFVAEAERVVANLDHPDWVQLRSLVEQAEDRWPADHTGFRAPWEREEIDPLAVEIHDFLHSHGLIVHGFHYTAWDPGSHKMNLFGPRNLAQQLDVTETVGLIAGSSGTPHQVADSLENGSLTPLLGRLLDFRTQGDH